MSEPSPVPPPPSNPGPWWIENTIYRAAHYIGAALFIAVSAFSVGVLRSCENYNTISLKRAEQGLVYQNGQYMHVTRLPQVEGGK